MNDSETIFNNILYSLDNDINYHFNDQKDFENHSENIFNYAVKHNNEKLISWLFNKNHSDFELLQSMFDKLMNITKKSPNYLSAILDSIDPDYFVWNNYLYRSIIAKSGEILLHDHEELNTKLIHTIKNIPDIHVLEVALQDIITHHPNAIPIYEELTQKNVYHSPTNLQKNIEHSELFNASIRTGNADYIRYFFDKLTEKDRQQNYFLTDSIFMLVLSNKVENISLLNELLNIDLYSSYSPIFIHQSLGLGGKSLDLISHIYENGGRYLSPQHYFNNLKDNFNTFIDFNELFENLPENNGVISNEEIYCITSHIIKYEPENLSFFIEKIQESNYPEIAEVVLKIKNKHHLDDVLNINIDKSKNKMKI